LQLHRSGEELLTDCGLKPAPKKLWLEFALRPSPQPSPKGRGSLPTRLSTTSLPQRGYALSVCDLFPLSLLGEGRGEGLPAAPRPHFLTRGCALSVCDLFPFSLLGEGRGEGLLAAQPPHYFNGATPCLSCPPPKRFPAYSRSDEQGVAPFEEVRWLSG